MLAPFGLLSDKKNISDWEWMSRECAKVDFKLVTVSRWRSERHKKNIFDFLLYDFIPFFLYNVTVDGGSSFT